LANPFREAAWLLDWLAKSLAGGFQIEIFKGLPERMAAYMVGRKVRAAEQDDE